MPEYRQNFITKEWVIIAPERAKRPDQFAKKNNVGDKTLPARDEKCPFCPGNEDQTPPPTLVRGRGDGWQLRVVPNKFAAVNPELPPGRQNSGKFLSASGFGIAEVVIESPIHNTSLELLSTSQVKDVLGAYKNRYTDHSKNKNIDTVIIFRNHGASAGTSLEHPHSQIIATPIVPLHLRQLMQNSLLYHDTYGECPYCVMIEEEFSQAKRILIEGKYFVVFCPYASRVPFETRIIPKRHHSRFDSILPEEMDELSEIFKNTLQKIHIGLNDPDYNFVIHTSPASEGELDYDHWQISILPRLSTPAGFEIGSGIFINTMPPENAAEFLRSVKTD